MSRKNSSSMLSSKKIWPIILAIIALAVLCGLMLNKWQNNNSKNTGDTTQDSASDLNLAPPTEEEKKAVEEHKDELVKQQGQQSSPPNGRVTPLIADAGYYDNQLEVRSFVPGIFEAGGKCLITASKGSEKVSREVIATQGATTTDCPVTTIPRSQLSAGNWIVVVSYSSQAYQGISESRTVEVP